MPLIKHIAKKFYNVSFEDLIQVGTIGVLKALKNYQKNGNCKFETYAYDYIFGEMYEFVMKDKKIKITKDILRLAKKIQVAKNTLALKTGVIPNYDDIGKFLGIDGQKIAEVMNLTNEMISLDNNNEEARELYETIPMKEKVSLDEKITLQSGLETLPDSEKEILQYRYFKDLTQQETANKMGMTQVMISRYEQKGLKRLRKYYEVG